jgi:spermidine/putrescine transport system substrate-binding protein
VEGLEAGADRRAFLKGSAALAVAGLLAGCASDIAGRGTVPLPRPGHPVTWPVLPGVPRLSGGLPPEQHATLQVYTWEAYINQDVVNSFAKKFKCKVQITTFNTMNEALSKLRSGLSFDVLVGATVDVLGQLIEGALTAIAGEG